MQHRHLASVSATDGGRAIHRKGPLGPVYDRLGGLEWTLILETIPSAVEHGGDEH